MRYEPASSTPRATGCQTGTLALGRAIRAVYPELETLTAVYGCYNRRPIAGQNTWSLHAEGRALDVGVDSPEAGLGWQLACELTRDRVLYGVQRVIWDRHIWSVERIKGWERLRASSAQHLDHLHIEQYRAAAGRPVDSQLVLSVGLRRARTASDAGGAA